MAKKAGTKIDRFPQVQPAPAEGVRVCTICRFEPETCGHKTEIKDRSWLREACVWCCDWKPREN